MKLGTKRNKGCPMVDSCFKLHRALGGLIFIQCEFIQRVDLTFLYFPDPPL